jgi:ubiquinone/menaquinone biosynthesis C-methylase UbiE
MKYYNDQTFSYPAFWKGREYEHEAEVMAVRTLLQGKRFDTIADIGGGFGRLTDVLAEHGAQHILVDPANVQRELVKDFVQNSVTLLEGNSEQTNLADESIDLAIMVRVAHHILNPKPSFHELWRILKPKGLLILEFANSTNFKARARNGFRPTLLSTIDIGSTKENVPFVNHHPATIKRILREEGFIIIEELSVSNLRSLLLKKIFSTKTLLAIERYVQDPFSKIYFGPSIFVLAQKV